MSAILVRGVVAHHPGGAGAALRGVDFEAATAEVHAVLGPNGAGKTTLVRVVAGLLRAATGSVELLGAPLATLGVRERARRVAVVPQGLEAMPPTTVRGFVAGGRYAHRGGPGGAPADARAVAAALERTGIAAFASRPLSGLSGGERQRALVARALAQDAPILLCDEPTASLDVDQQIAVLEILAAESCRGRAVVIVTHELNLASQFADRVTLLHEGRVAARGTTAEVLVRDVLVPIYGDALHFGVMPGGAPMVVPQRRPGMA